MTRITRLAASLMLGLTAMCLLQRDAAAQGHGLGLVSDPHGRVVLNESVITESTGAGLRRVPFGPRFRGYSEYGDGYGWNTEGQTYAGVFYPVHVTPFVDLFFVDAQGYVAYNNDGSGIARNNDRYGANVGVGYRRYLDQAGIILGGSLWYDVDAVHTNTWQRYGASFEAIMVNGLEVRVNGYLNDGDGSKDIASFLTGGPPRFQGNFIVSNRRNVRNISYEGVELELGGPVPYFQSIGLNAYGGGYWINNDAEDISRGGVMGRLESHIHEDVQIGMQVRHDDEFNTALWATLAVQLPSEPFRVWWRRFLEPRGAQQHLARRTERLWRIPVKQRVEDVQSPLIDPKDGRPIFVIHVDPNGGPGNGTFESPHNSASFANNADADIIRVLPGNFSPNSTIVLHDCQRLLGAAQPHFFTSVDGTFVLPGQVAGADPVISNTSGGNVVQLANNTEVSAVDIDGGGTGIGIVGTNVSDVSLNRLDIMNATDGIQLINLGQSGLAPPFGRMNLIEDVNVSGGTLTGIRILQNDGSTGVVTVNRINSNTNGFDGLLFDVQGGSTINATVSNASLNANARNGLRVILAGGSTATLNASDVNIDSSGQDGVFVDVRGASTLNPSTLTRFNVTNSGQSLIGGLRNGILVNVQDGSMGTLAIADSTSINTAGATQETGLLSRATAGGILAMTVNNTNLSGNADANLDVVTLTGGMQTLTASGITANGAGMDGFRFTTAGATFTASITDSSFDNNGRNAIRALGGTAPNLVNVTLDSTSSNNSGADGVFMMIAGGGGPSVFNFDYQPTSPSAILNSGSGTGVVATFTGAGTTGTVAFNGITIDGGITAVTVGTTVTVTP